MPTRPTSSKPAPAGLKPSGQKPATPSPTIPPRAILLLALLTLVWGTNWGLFPYAVREVSVWTFRAVSVLGAGLALLAAGAVTFLSVREGNADGKKESDC